MEKLLLLLELMETMSLNLITETLRKSYLLRLSQRVKSLCNTQHQDPRSKVLPDGIDSRAFVEGGQGGICTSWILQITVVFL